MIEIPNTHKKVVELRQTTNGIFYITVNGKEQQNTFTMDVNLAHRFYDIAVGDFKNNQDNDAIIKSNVETRIR